MDAYSHKLTKLWSSHAWPGHDILAKAGTAHAAPSVHGAWTFTTAYANSIWMALVAGLLIAASVEALVPQRWLLRVPEPEHVDLDALPAFRLSSAPRRFVLALARLALTLLPEYLLVVFLLGLFRGWLFPLDGSAAHWGVLAAIVAAVLGTLVVIPTAGEIPIAQGLAVAGVNLGAVGALLITLPAISLVSMAMVARAFSVRVVTVTAGAVAATGVLAGALLWALSA